MKRQHGVFAVFCQGWKSETLTGYVFPRSKHRSITTFFSTALLVSMFVTPGAYANVFDHDDRRPLTAEDGFEAVGQIACANSTRLPIGTIISHDALPDDRDYELVVTVAHTFRGRGGVMETRCDFLPGGDREAATPLLHVALGTLAPGRAFHHDWAVAIVSGRLSDTHGALPLATLTEDDLPFLEEAGARYSLVGKNGERPRMLISENCAPVPKLHWHHGFFSQGELNHNCDMIPGWSGGPLVMTLNGKRQIVGINATELNGIIHKVGDAYHPRMFANTAIRYTGDFKATVARMAATPFNTDDLSANLHEQVAFSVLPESCKGEADMTSNILDLAVEIALVPAAEARSFC